MIRLNLSAEVRTILMDFHQHHIHPTIRQRAHVLLLRSANLSNSQISNITALSEPTIIDYVHQYLAKGESWITALLNFNLDLKKQKQENDLFILWMLKFQLFTEEQVQKNVGRPFDQPVLRRLPAESLTNSSTESRKKALQKAA